MPSTFHATNHATPASAARTSNRLVRTLSLFVLTAAALTFGAQAHADSNAGIRMSSFASAWEEAGTNTQPPEVDQQQVNTVPAPGTLALLGLGVGLAVLVSRRR